MSDSLRETLEARRRSGGKALVVYLTAGVPSVKACLQLAVEASRYADAIEIGVPFSDPIMDGPIIQRAAQIALDQGIGLQRSLDISSQLAGRIRGPVVVMTYYNPVLAMGLERFAKSAARAGVAGAIVPDLPLEEGRNLFECLRREGVAAVLLVAPTTPRERVNEIVSAADGFIYAVSRLGVTGLRTDLAQGTRATVGRIRACTKLPVLLGIGISTAEQAVLASESSDGVIVGSAFVERVLDNGDPIGFLRGIRDALDAQPG